MKMSNSTQKTDNVATMSLVGLVSAIAPYLKIRHVADKAIIDDFIFRAHYRLTTSIFFVSCIFVTATNLLGEPIECIADEKSVPKHVMNTFCWVNSTFTMPNKGEHRKSEIYQGVRPSLGADDDANQTYHAYYQWVPFLLFFHGLCFYGPHLLWKAWEGGNIGMITEGIRGTVILDTEGRKQRRAQVVNFLIDTLHTHSKYVYAYFFCEMLNFINVFATMYMINYYLNGAFMTYGMEVLKFALEDPDERNDPMIKVFPRMTKCTFNKFGPSGSMQNHDALCVLALNNVNEKIYIFVWFWLYFLCVISFLALVYTATLATIRPFRQMVIIKRFKFGTKHNVNRLIKNIQIGDFLLLHFLGLNLNSLGFHHLLEDLNDKLHSGRIPENTRRAANSHPDDQYPIYPENINSMGTMELDRFQPTEPLIKDRKENLKSV